MFGDVASLRITAAVLDKAAKAIEQHGLANGTRLATSSYSQNPHGSMCVIGALNVGLGQPANSFTLDKANRLDVERMLRLLPIPQDQNKNFSILWNLAQWSNELAAKQQASVVINALRKAASDWDTSAQE